MLRIALWEPEIPPNTGNIARLCAATGAELHLVGRLGFHTDDRSLRRAGLDYWDEVSVHYHDTVEEVEALFAPRIFCFSAHAERLYTAVRYEAGDCLLFGSESRGLPDTVLGRHSDRTVTIPMPAGGTRSLNLATCAGIALYEALRQIHGW